VAVDWTNSEAVDSSHFDSESVKIACSLLI